MDLAVQAVSDANTPSAAAVLERLLLALPQDRVSLGWFHAELREHSFEMLGFVMALIGVLPGASVVIGFLMAVPALGMMFSDGKPLPRLVAARSVSTRLAGFVLGRAIPFLRARETAARRPQAPLWRYARPLVGLLVLILGPTLLVPIPLSNVLPALVIAGLCLAMIERNAVLLACACFAAFASLVFTGMTVAAASQAFANLFA